MPKVLNCREVPRSQPGSIYVGRPSKWGNPFKIGEDGTREEVVEQYRLYIEWGNPELLEQIEELRGQDLVCWCAPLPCHGDILLRLANEEKGD